jgi:hypothetical protein
MLHQAVRSAFHFAHPWRRPAFLELQVEEFREVSFEGADGLRLFGRFVTSRNGATILMAHGLGSSGNNLVAVARMLIEAGFGVLIMDLRAHGKSQGDTSTFGMRESEDVACAVKYLLSRIDVHGEKIGAYGISLGAQAVMRGALRTDHLRALVLEGPGPSVLSDHGGRPKSLLRWMNLPFNWLYYLVYQFMIGGRDQGVLEVINKLPRIPLLFIASGQTDIYFSRLFYEKAGEPKQIWELPQAVHGGALMQDPEEYRQRLVNFFNQSLNSGANSA